MRKADDPLKLVPKNNMSRVYHKPEKSKEEIKKLMTNTLPPPSPRRSAALTLWIAEVKWKDIEQEHTMENITGDTQFFGPFTEYDEGIKVWSAKFSEEHHGKFEYIDYHNLITPK